VRLVLLLVACLVAAGCTTVVEGTPSAPTGVLLPPRPREVRLDGVDPCSLLTPEQRVGLGFTSQPHATRPYVDLFRGDVPTCTLDSPSADPIILGIGVVTSVGIERWREGNLAAELQPTSVGGFPALIAQPTQSTAYCAVEVDVAPGQLLDVQLFDGGHTPPLRQEDLCSGAERAAGEIIETLAA
jgi:Protein of unknown function (DUF3558)